MPSQLRRANLFTADRDETLIVKHATDKESIIRIHKRIHQPIANATGLPNKRYTNYDAFIEDRDQVLGQNWAALAFIDDLPEANYALPIEFMGLPLLVTRDKADTYRVFHNVCSHRGMHLADVPCRTNGTVRCPYHSWTYDLDGSLRGTPHVGGYGNHRHPDFDSSANGLREVRSTLWLGTVFINLSGTAPAFDEYTNPLILQFNELCSAEQRKRFISNSDGCRTTLTVQSNWKLACENYLESYHLPTVHPELNRISPLDQHFQLDYFDFGAGQGSLNYQRLNIDDKSLPTLANWPTDQANKALYPVLYPNTLIGLHADHLFIMILQPVNEHETVEHVRLSYVDKQALSADYRQHHETLLSTWKNVFEEDIFAVERMQKGRSSPAYEGGAFAPAMDEPTHHFHCWIADQLMTHALP